MTITLTPTATSEQTLTVTLPATTLAAMMGATDVARSTDATRPQLCGWRIEVTGGELTITTTDSYRLATTSVTVDYTGDPISVTAGELVGLGWPKWSTMMPAAARKAIAGHQATITVRGAIGHPASTVTIDWAPGVAHTFTTEPDYPRYQSVIPTGRGADYAGNAPEAHMTAVNPRYLADLGAMVTRIDQVAGKDTSATVRLLACDPMRPTLWRLRHDAATVDYVLMPVRVS